MSFNKGDRISINNKWHYSEGFWAKSGMTGTIVKPRDDISIGCYDVEWDTHEKPTRPMHGTYLTLEQSNTVHRIVGPSGFTESLDKEQVAALVRTGIIFHNHTAVYDKGHIVKTYHNERDEYDVTDHRSNRPDLMKDFPKDN